jgi:hypothetical protein
VLAGTPPTGASALIALFEFPTFGMDHFLETYTFHAFGDAHKGNLSIFGAARMLVGDNCPVRAAMLGHRDDKRVGAIDAFVRPVFVVVRRHKRPDDLLHGNRLFHEEVVWALHQLWQSSPGLTSSKTAFGDRKRPAAISSSTRSCRPSKIEGGYSSMNHLMIELVSMQ